MLSAQQHVTVGSTARNRPRAVGERTGSKAGAMRVGAIDEIETRVDRWIIQDGNYCDFHMGAEMRCALGQAQTVGITTLERQVFDETRIH